MASISADELLIEEVRQRPVLYDQRLKTYRDSQLQYDAWLEISGVLQRDGKFFRHLQFMAGRCSREHDCARVLRDSLLATGRT